MIPSTSVSPAARRNSITPSCTPFRSCSKTRAKVMPPFLPRNKKGADPAPFLPPIRRLPFHLAFLVVGVLVILEDLLLDLHRDAFRRLGVLDRPQQVEVLDRVMVVVELEVPAYRLVVRLAHRGHHALGVLDVALDRAHRGVDEKNAVVALRAVV